MAEEELDQSRTEAPTPRRRQEARLQGQVASSSDLTTGLVLLAGVIGLGLGSQAMASQFLTGTRLDLLNCALGDLNPVTAQDLFWGIFSRGLQILGLFLGGMVVMAVIAPALQVGFHMVPSLVTLNLGRLSPAQGWPRLFSLAGGLRGLVALSKVLVIGLVVFWVLKGRSLQIAGLSEMPLGQAVAQGWALILHLALAVAGSLVLFGVGDYAFQRWRFEQSLRMTRQEMKEELKREEGDPLIKARIRKLQREAAQKSMFQDVPRATVVVTNPSHLAVALRFEKTMAAPTVIAKGAGHVAQRIIDIARRHAVPVVERKPLAQVLFKTVKIGQEIPAALYFVVAEVLAFVYRLRGGLAHVN